MIFCIPKKDGYGEYTKLRILRNGSFHAINKTAINEWIIKKRCKMPFIPNLKKYAKLLINKNYFALRDLSDFFRQISLAKEDCDYIGYSLFNMYFRDRRQPYGVSSAPANCQYFADLLIWIFDNKKLPINLRNNTLVHIDDFVMAAIKKIDCINMENTFDTLLNELNVLISHKKTINTCIEATVYGILWNLKYKTASIPNKKFDNLMKGIDLTIKYRVITGSALDKLAGKMMNYSQLNVYAKALCYNLMGYIYDNFRTKIYSKNTIIALPLSIINDLKFWKKYALTIKTVPISYILNTPKINISGSSDACKNGAGFIIGPYWAKYKFKQNHLNWHINQKEAHAILTLLHTLRYKLTGSKLILYIDNEPIYNAMKRKWSPKPSIMMFIYEISLLLIEYKIWIYVDWIDSESNTLSDCLSRDEMIKFWKLSKIYELNLEYIPLKVDYFNNFKFVDDKCTKYENDMIEYQKFINWLKIPMNKRHLIPYSW